MSLTKARSTAALGERPSSYMGRHASQSISVSCTLSRTSRKSSRMIATTRCRQSIHEFVSCNIVIQRWIGAHTQLCDEFVNSESPSPAVGEAPRGKAIGLTDRACTANRSLFIQIILPSDVLTRGYLSGSRQVADAASRRCLRRRDDSAGSDRVLVDKFHGGSAQARLRPPPTHVLHPVAKNVRRPSGILMGCRIEVLRLDRARAHERRPARDLVPK